MKNECSIDECSVVVAHRGWCKRHYERWRVHGDPNYTKISPREMPLVDRIKRQGWVVTSSGCWEYAGLRDKDGYGILSTREKGYRAHRVMYEGYVGPIPQGLLVRHKCDNPPCVNPEHLETGTHTDNRRDRIDRGR